MSKFTDGSRVSVVRIVGIATIWNSQGNEIGGRPVFGLLNTLYEPRHPDDCELCARGIPVEHIPY